VGNLDRAHGRSRRGSLTSATSSLPRTVAGIAGLLLGSTAAAQPAGPDSQPGVLTPPEPVLVAPVFEGGVRKNRGIAIPVNLRAGPERRVGGGYTASNSYLNPGLLVCRDGSCRLDYETDHTGNLFFVGVTQPLLRAFEVGFTIGTYEMGDIPDLALVHRLASDGALRTFHEDVLHEDSLPELSQAPDGRQVFTMTDLEGRRLTLVAGHRYALPLRVDLTRYFDIRRTSRARMSLSAGAHLSYPLEGDLDAATGHTAMVRGLDFGLSVDFTRSRRITSNVSSTWHVQLGRFRQDVHVVNASSPRQGDDRVRSQYALTFGLRFANMFSGNAPCSFSLGQVTTSALFDKDTYWTQDTVLFEGGNNLRGALAGANDYGVATFACEHRRREFQLSLVEDIGGLSQLIDDDGAGTSYDPDFAVGVTISWNPGQRENRRL
jgi:hypothetical protein